MHSLLVYITLIMLQWRAVFMPASRRTRCARCNAWLPQMKAVAAYLLLVLGGNTAPAKADIEKVLNSVEAEVDGEAIDRLLTALEGKVCGA